MTLKQTIAAVLFTATTLSACSITGDEIGSARNNVPDPPSIDTMAVVAKDILRRIQPLSIHDNREYCGLIFSRADGSLYASHAIRGGTDWCIMPKLDTIKDYQPSDQVVADFHTHASFDENSDSETPSVLDMNGNKKAGIAGFLATPGGRFWHVSADGSFAEQICGPKCLPSDTRFADPEGEWEVPERLTLRQVVQRHRK